MRHLASFFDYCVILLGISLAGVIFLSRRDRLIFGAVLLPGILAILYLGNAGRAFLLSNRKDHALNFAVGGWSGVRCAVQGFRTPPDSWRRNAKEAPCHVDRCCCSRRVRAVLFRGTE